MTDKERTYQLENQLWRHTQKRGTFGCFEVTIGWRGKERVDYLTYDTQGIFRCYELKVSKADFYSDNKLSFLGHYNYFVLPLELYEQVKEDIDDFVGVYVPSDGKFVSVKIAKKCELKVDKDILKDSMIRSLYRKSEKVISNRDVLEIEKVRKDLNRAKKKSYQNYRQHMDLRKKLYQKYGDRWIDGWMIGNH